MIDEPRITEVPAVSAAIVRLTIPRAEMAQAFPRAIHEILDALADQGITPAGPPFARHLRHDPEVFDFEVGFPVEHPVRSRGRVNGGELPAARVVRTVHHGAYTGLPEAWRAFEDEVRRSGLDVVDEFRERYLVGPESGPDPSGWRTELSRVLLS